MMYTLLTGATGLVGRYLVRDLLLSGHELAVVVRASRRQSPRERMEEILQHWESVVGRPLPRPVVLSGDISEPGFGLNDEDQEWVRQHCTSIIHSAAILEFYGKDRAGEPWRSNLNGTQNMINLCRELGVRDIHHVSTAYVAGLQTGRVMEESLDAGQSFRNDYEESKFLAEKLVRQIDFADHVTVYRPAVISGDSVTGYTNTYHGIYLYLRLMALMIPTIPQQEDGRRCTPVRLRMTGEERRNIIPVDWVSAVMCRLFETPEARGLTFHIAPDNPVTSRNLIGYCAEYFNTYGTEFVGNDAPEEVNREVNEDQWMFERLVRENAETYAPYERTDNVFDMTNVRRFAGDIVCPEIDKTVIFRYLEFGNQDRWGKRKPDVNRVSIWAEDQLSAAAQAGSGDVVRSVGLDLTGPGGCQVTAHVSSHGIVSVERGLPESGIPVLRVCATDLNAVMRGERQLDSVTYSWESIDALSKAELADLVSGLLSADSLAART